MSKIDDGGDAFPTIWQPPFNADFETSSGMALRDWFAGQALAHMVSSAAVELPTWEHVAAACYDAADAMIAARAKATTP